jgi:hypothetical protein
MLSRGLMIGAAVLALAGCESRPYDPYTGARNDGYGYGSSAAPQGTGDGCAGGQQADPLHQNRPGGSDYSRLRCRTRGY